MVLGLGNCHMLLKMVQSLSIFHDDVVSKTDIELLKGTTPVK